VAHKKAWDFTDAPLISRDQARAEGLNKFFTGQPCVKGHVAPRYVRMANCVVCSAEAALAWQKRMYLSDGDTIRIRHRESRLRHPVAYMVRDAKARARRKGQEFSITKDDLTMPSSCPCCGGKIAMRTGPAKRGPTPHSPSIDRLDSNFGYVPGNVAIICWRCNELKRNATADELRKILAWIEGTQKRGLSVVVASFKATA